MIPVAAMPPVGAVDCPDCVPPPDWTERLRAAAESLAAQGWHVFPCKPNRKQPATRDGHLDATTELVQIRRWWDGNTHYNIGVATGPSGLVVVDVDEDAAVKTLVRRGFLLPPTLSSVTPRGGTHSFYDAGGSCLRNMAGALPNLGRLAGVDVRADGGYVLVPPSRVGDHEYEWVPGTPDLPGPLPAWMTPLPGAGFRSLKPRPRQGASPRGRLLGLARAVEQAREGSRNTVLNWASYTARGLVGELGRQVVERRLMDAAVASGLPATEAARTIRSGLGT